MDRNGRDRSQGRTHPGAAVLAGGGIDTIVTAGHFGCHTGSLDQTMATLREASHDRGRHGGSDGEDKEGTHRVEGSRRMVIFYIE